MKFNRFEYLPITGNMQVRLIDGDDYHRYIYSPGDEAVEGEAKFVVVMLGFAVEVEDSPVKKVLFDADKLLVVDGVSVLPDDDITSYPAEIQAFCNAVWDNGGRKLWEAKQALLALKTQESNDG